MAKMTTKKTAAGAQQYTTEKGMARATKTLEPDIRKFIDGDMSVKEFEKKHGVHPLKASSMLFGASMAKLSDSNTKEGRLDFAKDIDDDEIMMSRTGKRYNKGGYAKSYNKGGYVNCGASVPGTQNKK